MPQRPMSVNPTGTVLSLHLRSSSISSSPSPGDSGVAFDSDMDIANETDGSSYKEVRLDLIKDIDIDLIKDTDIDLIKIVGRKISISVE